MTSLWKPSIVTYYGIIIIIINFCCCCSSGKQGNNKSESFAAELRTTAKDVNLYQAIVYVTCGKCLFKPLLWLLSVMILGIASNIFGRQQMAHNCTRYRSRLAFFIVCLKLSVIALASQFRAPGLAFTACPSKELIWRNFFPSFSYYSL